MIKSKSSIQQILDSGYVSEDQIKFIHMLLTKPPRTKADLYKIGKDKDNTNGVDTAYPHQWGEILRRHGVEPNMFMVDYSDGKNGEPVNTAEVFVDKIIKVFSR